MELKKDILMKNHSCEAYSSQLWHVFFTAVEKAYQQRNRVLDYFEELFPDAHCELNHQNVFELLVAVMLSAQTTDKKVNQVTASLFKKYPTVESFALASLEDLPR